MAALLADGWFYISSAGLIVSGGLFFFLLSQYRAAADAADQPEPEVAAPALSPSVQPVWSSAPPAPTSKLTSVPAAKTEEPDAPPAPSKPAPAPTPLERKTESTTGAISPAVVYLQSIKLQLEELQGETRKLAKCVDAITSRDEALIERLSELTQAVADLKSAAAPAPAPVETPVPKRAKKAEAAVVVEPAPAPAPAPEPVVAAEPAKKVLSADETVRMGLDDVIASQLAKMTAKKETPAPAAETAPPPASEPEPDEKPRRGPVWPV